MYSIHFIQRVLHTVWTLSTAYIDYCIHRVPHTLSTACTEFWIIPRLTVPCSHPVSHLSPLIPQVTILYPTLEIPTITIIFPMNSVSAPITPPAWAIKSWRTTSKYSNPEWSWTASPLPNSLRHGLKVHLTTHSIIASKYLFQAALITVSKCISNITWQWPPSTYLSSLDLWLKLNL